MNIEELPTVPLFMDLSGDELLGLAPLLETRTVPDGQRIVQESESIDSLYIICQGVVHVRRMAGKKEALLARMTKGGFFGEINLFGEGKATASVYALSRVVLASVSYETLKAYFSQNPVTAYKVTARILSETCKRLILSNNRYISSVFWKESQE